MSTPRFEVRAAWVDEFSGRCGTHHFRYVTTLAWAQALCSRLADDFDGGDIVPLTDDARVELEAARQRIADELLDQFPF